MSEFEDAKGIIPWKEGDAMPEDFIQGARGNFEPLYRHYRKVYEEAIAKLTQQEAVVVAHINDLKRTSRVALEFEIDGEKVFGNFGHELLVAADELEEALEQADE